MNIKLPSLIKKIFDLGSFSNPLLNYLLESEVEPSLRHYLISLKLIWEREYRKALEEVELGIKKCKNNRSLHYALLSNKFIILYYLRDYNSMEYLYYKLRREYLKIPPSIRKIINQYLINYSFMIKDVDLPKSRFWSKINILSPSTKLFLTIGNARKRVKEGKILDAVDLYQEGVKLASKIPHPSGLITCLNDLAWYLKDVNILKSYHFTRECIYYLGYYYEEPKKYFYALDTIFEVQRLVRDYRIFETAELISQFKDDEFVKSKYKKLLNDSLKYDLKFDQSIYKLTPELIRFLKRNIKSVYNASKLTNISRAKLTNILKGKVKNVRGKTIKKLLKGLKLEFDESLPKEFIIELIKINIDKEFESIKNFIKDKKKHEIEKLLLSTYMALYKRKEIFNYITRKNVLKSIFDLINLSIDSLISFLERKYETKRFSIYLFNPPPFVMGRKSLTFKFLNSLNDEMFNNLLRVYLDLEEEKRTLLDVFIRNYMRFSKVPLNLEFESKYIKSNCVLFDSDSTPFLLSMYYFKKWDRIKLLRILNKLENFMILLE